MYRQLNKKQWLSFTPQQMSDYVDEVFTHYRTTGFPFFPTDTQWRKDEFKSLISFDFSKCVDADARLIKQSMHGLALCWSYHPHHYRVKCNNLRTVYELFSDDDLLRKCIEKRIKMGDNMSDNGLRKMMKIYTGTQCVSNFRPTAAAALYSVFCKKGDCVYDRSAGYGGRCLGAAIAGVRYYGVDPATETYAGLVAMVRDFELDATVLCQGSEERSTLPDNSIDFSFTSPPYFDCEKYSEEGTQSYVKYPSKDLWMNSFMRKTLIEAMRVTKEGKKIAINIQAVKSYKNIIADLMLLAKDIGLKASPQWNLQLSRLGRGGHKTEPILVFEK
jgi:hypothetical protein